MKLLRTATALSLLLATAPALADNLADGSPLELLDIDDEWVTGLQQPTAMAFLPDGRVVITQREGGVLVRTPEGDLVEAGSISVSTGFQEKGLLNVLPHPDYAENNLLYFYYTGSGGGGGDDNRVVTMTLSEDNVLDVGSEIRLVEGIAAPLNHDGGGLAILGDYLFIGTGDSGSNSNAEPDQNRVTNYYPTCFTNLNGKILRLHLDGTIPEDNPLVGKTVTACGGSPGTAPTETSDQPRTEIWAWGIRNAFRLWADPATQHLWVGHVGEVTYEMVNVVPPTGNVHFGWPFREGGEGQAVATCQDYEPNVGDCVDPVYKCESSNGNPGSGDYNPDVPDDCDSMTGGLILSGCEWPAELEGQYVFGDYESDRVWTLQLNDEHTDVIAERVDFASLQGGGPVQFVEHEGALYIVAFSSNSGHIARISPKTPEASCDGPVDPPPGGGGAGGDGGAPVPSSSGGGGGGGTPPTPSVTSEPMTSASGAGSSSTPPPPSGAPTGSAAVPTTGGSSSAAPNASSGAAPGASSAAPGASASAPAGSGGMGNTPGSSTAEDDKGCGCRVGASNTTSHGAWGVAALALAALWRRKRRN